MQYRYNIPQNNYNMQKQFSYNNYPKNNFNNNDRFIGGGFIAPFLLGGIAGSLVTRPNYGYPVYPQPIPYYPPRPYYYSNNNNYYY